MDESWTYDSDNHWWSLIRRVILTDHKRRTCHKSERIIKPSVRSNITRDKPAVSLFSISLCHDNLVQQNTLRLRSRRLTTAVTIFPSAEPYPRPCFLGEVTIISRQTISSFRIPKVSSMALFSFTITSNLRCARNQIRLQKLMMRIWHTFICSLVRNFAWSRISRLMALLIILSIRDWCFSLYGSELLKDIRNMIKNSTHIPRDVLANTSLLTNRPRSTPMYKMRPIKSEAYISRSFLNPCALVILRGASQPPNECHIKRDSYTGVSRIYVCKGSLSKLCTLISPAEGTWPKHSNRWGRDVWIQSTTKTYDIPSIPVSFFALFAFRLTTCFL